MDFIPDSERWKLDREIDFENLDVPKDLGRIADSMTEWEGSVADELGLSIPDRNDIKDKNPLKPSLQR